MIYELLIAGRTLRNDGWRPLGRKVWLYFGQMWQAVIFVSTQGFINKVFNRSPLDWVARAIVSGKGCLKLSQVDTEILNLVDLVHAARPLNVLEIGTAHGGTLFLWCKAAHPCATICSIDLPGGQHGGGYPAWKKLLYRTFTQSGQNLRLIRASSHDLATYAAVRRMFPNGIDFLFIDGGHTYNDVEKDWHMYEPMVNLGGIIAFHDIVPHADMSCQVDEFWSELKRRFKTVEFVEDWKQGTCGIGVILKPL